MTAPLPLHLLSLALCLSSGFQQGYIAVVLNQPYLAIEEFISDSWTDRFNSTLNRNTLNVLWSTLNVLYPFSVIFGQFWAADLCARFGRKPTAVFASLLYLPGILLSYFSKTFDSWEILFIARIIWSLANGIHVVNATVWIVECAPAKHRGGMAALQELYLSLGSLAAQGIGVPFSTAETWPLVFLPAAVTTLISLVVFMFVYESPQYIIDKKNDPDKAKKALAWYHGKCIDDPELDEEMKICETSGSKGNKKNGSTSGQATHDGLTTMFMPWKANDPYSQVIRQAAWIGLMVKVAYVFTGARCLRAYSTFILHTMSHWTLDHALYGSFIIGLARVPVTLVPVFLVDRVGRRPLMIVSMFISILSLLVVMAGIEVGGTWKIATMVGLSSLLIVNACGLGSVSRFYAAELVPRHLLLNAVSVLALFEALSKIAIEFVFYPLANIIGSESMLIFAVPSAILLFVIYRYCPETSRRNVNQVLNEIAQRRGLQMTCLA